MATKKVKDDTQEAIDASIAEHGEAPYQGYSLVETPAPTKHDFVTNANRRSDDDCLHLHACRVVNGEHKGRYGVLRETSSLAKDGYPDEVVIHTFDADGLTLTVNYADIRPSAPGLW